MITKNSTIIKNNKATVGYEVCQLKFSVSSHIKQNRTKQNNPEQHKSRPRACLSFSSKHNLKHFEWKGAKFSPLQASAAVGKTLPAGLMVKHNVCLWSLRCQSSILTNTPLLLNPHCVLLNGFVYQCVLSVCVCFLQREGARGRV